MKKHLLLKLIAFLTLTSASYADTVIDSFKSGNSQVFALAYPKLSSSGWKVDTGLGSTTIDGERRLMATLSGPIGKDDVVDMRFDERDLATGITDTRFEDRPCLPPVGVNAIDALTSKHLRGSYMQGYKKTTPATIRIRKDLLLQPRLLQQRCAIGPCPSRRAGSIAARNR